MKRLHTDNRKECIMLKFQFFLTEQESIYETSALHIHQQNGHTKPKNYILLKKV